MDYFAGLDISMDETHICVVDREGVVYECKAASTAGAIAGELEVDGIVMHLVDRTAQVKKGFFQLQVDFRQVQKFGGFGIGEFDVGSNVPVS